MNTTSQRRKKSEKLSKEEIAALKKWLKGKATIIDAAEELEVSRYCLHDVRNKWSASPDTIAKIRNVISKQ